jgi:hypothetical protein
MNTLQKHNNDIANKDYTGIVTDFSGYIQFGAIHARPDHDVIGFTADLIKKCVEAITSEKYLYSRQKNGYISLYGKDDTSPTGVHLIGGLPNELEFLLYAYGKTGQLSPNEDLRTAH